MYSRLDSLLPLRNVSSVSCDCRHDANGVRRRRTRGSEHGASQGAFRPVEGYPKLVLFGCTSSKSTWQRESTISLLILFSSDVESLMEADSTPPFSHPYRHRFVLQCCCWTGWHRYRGLCQSIMELWDLMLCLSGASLERFSPVDWDLRCILLSQPYRKQVLVTNIRREGGNTGRAPCCFIRLFAVGWTRLAGDARWAATINPEPFNAPERVAFSPQCSIRCVFLKEVFSRSLTLNCFPWRPPLSTTSLATRKPPPVLLLPTKMAALHGDYTSFLRY